MVTDAFVDAYRAAIRWSDLRASYLVLLNIILLGLPISASAYDEHTHFLMTQQAITGSVLSSSSPSVLAQLLPSHQIPASEAFSAICLAASGVNLAACVAAQGAYEEDTQGSPAVRMVNHFYDYQNAAPDITAGVLSDFSILRYLYPFPLLQLPNASPNWILNGAGQSLLTSLNGSQIATYEPFPAGALAPISGVKIDYLNTLTAQTVVQRQAAAQQLFLELGHVLHHIQDMAQPQHVRNDNHCNPVQGIFLDPVICAVGGNSVLSGFQPSRYESWVLDHGQAVIRSVKAHTNLPTTPAGAQVFSVPADFWTSEYGIAAFASTNFFSAGTNVSLSTIGGFKIVDSSTEANPAAAALITPAPTVSGAVLNSTYSVLVKDSIDNSGTVHPATVSPSLGALLGTFSLLPTVSIPFKLDEAIYNDQMNTLVPQAVTYSQWFVDYLFRASISGSLSSDGSTLNIQNTGTTAEVLNADGKGSFALYQDDPTSGVRREVWSSVGASCQVTNIAPGQSGICNVTDLGLPPASGSYLLAYLGKWGAESNQVAFTTVSLQPSQLVINFAGSSPGWTVTTTITLTDFQQTSVPLFQISGDLGSDCGGEQGGPVWSSTVLAGAVFNSASEVSGEPLITARSWNRPGCSSFVAYLPIPDPKGVQAPRNRIWANATADSDEFDQDGFETQWEAQTRFDSGDPWTGAGAVCEVGYVDVLNQTDFFPEFSATCSGTLQ